jgi:hypothetical protein
MKAIKIVLALGLAAGAVLASGSALAHGRVHFGLGLNFGFPVWGPSYYYAPPPAYYYPQTVVVPAAPQVYIERGNQAAPAPTGGNWWYYCGDSRAYYPYVKDCPGGWQRVSPTPQR